MSAKIVALIGFSLIAAGFSGYGLAEIMPNDTSSEENLDNFSEKSIASEFSQGEKLVILSSSTQINP